MEYIEVRGENFTQAMNKLREKHGNEAMLINREEVPVKGLFSKITGKKETVLRAALLEKKKPRGSQSRPALSKPATQEAATTSLIKEKSVNSQSNDDFAATLRNLSEKFAREENSFQEPSKSSEAVPSGKKTSEQDVKFINDNNSNRAEENSELFAFKKDIEFIKENLSKMAHQPGHVHLEREFQALYDSLLAQDFSESWARDMVTSLKQYIPRNEWNNRRRVYLKAVEHISSRIKANPALGVHRNLVFLGPTGVGKTTTIAKMAANLIFKEGRTAGLVSLDNYRLAAREQLRKYSEILETRMLEASTPANFHEVLKQTETEFDYVMIDTTGLSQNNMTQLHERALFFKEDFTQKTSPMSFEKFLVLPANAKPRDLDSIIDGFEVFRIDRFILSKVDESQSFGAIVELAESWNKPIAFVTFGQEVPNDIMNADKETLARNILADYIGEPMQWGAVKQ